MLKFDEYLASIHAYLCADGYVIRNPITQKQKYYYIGLRNTNILLLRDFQHKFHKLFGIKPRITKDGRAVVQNKRIYHELTENFSYYSREWNIPKGLSLKCIKSWLRSFFDCEGWVFVKAAKNRHIGADSVNLKGLSDIRKRLMHMGIKTKMKFIRKKEIYRLIIYGKENIVKFRDNLGFLHPDKMAKLNKAIISYKNDEWEFPDNINELKKFVSKKIKLAFSRRRKRISSVIKQNLVRLAGYSLKMYKLDSKIYGPIKNGNGTIYYELNFINNR